MTARDVLRTQSLQLPEYSCEDYNTYSPKTSKTQVSGGGNKRDAKCSLNKRQFTKELIFSKTSNAFHMHFIKSL